MRSLLDRVRWLAAPLAAYLAITLILPAAHGAARRGRFLHHAGWVLAGCAAAIAAAAFADAVFGNKRCAPRVPPSGGSS